MNANHTNAFPCQGPAHPQVRPRAILSETLAAEIYSSKIEFLRFGRSKISGKSAEIARMHNVSPKAIRDIWNHHTWKKATRHLWQASDVAAMQMPTSTEVLT